MYENGCSVIPTLCNPMNCSQVPLPMGFLRQEYWNRLPFPSPGDLADPGIESQSLTWQTDSLPLHHPGSIWVDLGNSTPTSYSWDKYHLGVVYSSSAVFHGFISCGKNLCIYVYQIYWQVLFCPIDVYLYILPSDRTKIKLS